MHTALLALYLVIVTLCAVHGAHRLGLLWVYVRRPPDRPPPPLVRGEEPFVTVQLPVYNERDVVERLVDAVAALDWPADRLQIQLLDDSSDDTGACALRAIGRACARGIDASIVRRPDRRGFKAGALAVGLQSARADLIAVFDADFIPASDFLRRLVPSFADPGIGMVQARWDHLNAGTSALTAAEALLLDGHFVVEHTARHAAGRWFNFNGTAGIWRRAAIEAAGGWQHDTLTEDLDLSYRAQLAGWRFLYRLDHVAPAELPESLAAFRSQQRRWAKGSVEVAFKLGRRILGARHVPLHVRFEALFHLWGNLAWPVALALALVLPAVVVSQGGAPSHLWAFVPAFVLNTGANLLFYYVASPGRAERLPLATLLGIGMAVNQTFAVVEALAGHRTPFVRTPKSGGGSGSYRVSVFAPVPLEIALALLHLGTATWAVREGAYGSVPFLLLFGLGFGWTGFGGLRERLLSAPAPVLTAEPAPLPGK